MANLTLLQNQTGIARTGDRVQNAGTTCCALVMAFNTEDDRVACYHWPGLNTECEEYMKTFEELYSSLAAPVTKVYVLINETVGDSYIKSLQILRGAMSGAPVICYVKTGVLSGDLFALISEDGNIKCLYEHYDPLDF